MKCTDSMYSKYGYYISFVCKTFLLSFYLREGFKVDERNDETRFIFPLLAQVMVLHKVR